MLGHFNIASMRSEKSRIVSWLQDTVEACGSPSRKRRRPIPSPPASGGNSFEDGACRGEHNMSPADATPKKRKTAVGAVSAMNGPFDNQQTPRPAVSLQGHSDVGSPDISNSESTTNSRRSSPSKTFSRFPLLSIDPSGIETAVIDLDDVGLPEAAKMLVEDMSRIAAGDAVVPLGLKTEIEGKRKTTRGYFEFREFVYTSQDSDDNETQSLRRLLEDVLEIVANAKECQAINQDESGWNNHVHSPLLTMALHRPLQQLVGYSACMTASILPTWRNKLTPGTRIDYAMVLRPDQDADPVNTCEAVRQMRYDLPDGSANHTGFEPLQHRPISVSIETKRYGGQEKAAEFQLGVWQAAQWRLLAYQAGDNITTLPFIPGVVVSDHEWSLVLTTYTGGKTKLWSRRPFGSTATLLGTFQALAGIKRLAQWSTVDYWPWYKAYVLRLPTDAAGVQDGE